MRRMNAITASVAGLGLLLQTAIAPMARAVLPFEREDIGYLLNNERFHHLVQKGDIAGLKKDPAVREVDAELICESTGSFEEDGYVVAKPSVRFHITALYDGETVDFPFLEEGAPFLEEGIYTLKREGSHYCRFPLGEAKVTRDQADAWKGTYALVKRIGDIFKPIVGLAKKATHGRRVYDDCGFHVDIPFFWEYENDREEYLQNSASSTRDLLNQAWWNRIDSEELDARNKSSPNPRLQPYVDALEENMRDMEARLFDEFMKGLDERREKMTIENGFYIDDVE